MLLLGLEIPLYLNTFLGAAFLLSVVIVVITYLIGRVFEHPQIMAIFKEELSALILTLMIIALWGFLDGVFSSVISSGAPMHLTSEAHITMAFLVFDHFIDKLVELYNETYLFEIFVGFLSTVSIPFAPLMSVFSIVSISFPVFPGLFLVANANTMLVEGIGYGLGIVFIQKHLLSFVAVAAPLFLFPMGIALRAFPWTRMTGSSLIAFSIILYYVYPASVILTGYMVFDLYKPSSIIRTPTILTLCSGGVDNLKDALKETFKLREDFTAKLSEMRKNPSAAIGNEGLFTKIKNLFSWIWDVAKSAVSNIGLIFKYSFSLGFSFFLPHTSWGKAFFDYFLFDLFVVFQFLVGIIVGLVIQIILSVTAYRSISGIIGGDIDLIGLTKLV